MKRSEKLEVRVSEPEKTAIARAAKREHLTASAWARSVLLKAAAAAALLLVVGCGPASPSEPEANCAQFGHFTTRSLAELPQDQQTLAAAMCDCTCQGSVASVQIDTCAWLATVDCACPDASDRVLEWKADRCWQEGTHP